MKNSFLRILALLLVFGAVVQTSRAAPPPPPVLLPLAGYAFQPGQPDWQAPAGSVVAFAPTTGVTHIETVSFVPFERLLSNDNDYRAFWLEDLDEKGNPVGSPLYFTTTQTAGTGTGDWTAGAPAFTAVLQYDLPAGHVLHGAWHAVFKGAPLPSGAWRIE